MTVDLDDEILQDFLVEAGEILELLGEQLVELEQSAEDFDLLNAIFRGFHTIKGGAGFLSLEPLVSVCHKAEDVFDVLREGERKVTPNLMDVILEVVDVVNLMFEQVKSGNYPDEAEQNLLTRLHGFTREGGQAAVEETSDAPVAESPQIEEQPAPPVEEKPIVSPVVNEDKNLAKETDSEKLPNVSDIVEQEFESMLVDVSSQEPSDQPASPADEITEQEFEELLDGLHGQGKFSAQGLAEESASQDQPDDQPTVNEPSPAVDSGDISEDEFEDLLDELHGKGSFSGENTSPAASPQLVNNSADISEEEFDQLMDELHGKGQFNGNVQNQVEQKTDQPVKESAPNPAKTEQSTETPKPKSTAITSKDKQGDKKNSKPAAGSGGQGETTVRVDTEILDDIMNMVGELVLVRNRFQTLKASADAQTNEHMVKAVSNLDVVTADLQLAVMKTRMQPIKKVFGRFPRVVRDLSRSLKKEIKLELVGEETDLDKNLVEALADPLVHLVRNAVDHGIESPEDRAKIGKPREGTVVLTASQEGDHIMLSIQDDGKGMNPDVLRKIVVDKGLMDEETAARLEDKECYNLIFMPGFSTKVEISDVSGRGVGMDVVKTRITQMNGVVEIDSVEGKGSTIFIKVPLTLAIMPTLMVILGGQAFALPLASVLEILDLDLSKSNMVDGQLVIMVRNRALPIFFLSEWLVNDPNHITDKQATGHVVVVNSGGRQIGFVVDQLIGQEEVVIKPLGAKLHGLEGLAGATITGDGKIALILDVPGLMQRYAG